MSDVGASVAEMRWGVRCFCAASFAIGTARYSDVTGDCCGDGQREARREDGQMG